MNCCLDKATKMTLNAEIIRMGTPKKNLGNIIYAPHVASKPAKKEFKK
jgi:hypothetical protein